MFFSSLVVPKQIFSLTEKSTIKQTKKSPLLAPVLLFLCSELTLIGSLSCISCTCAEHRRAQTCLKPLFIFLLLTSRYQPLTLSQVNDQSGPIGGRNSKTISALSATCHYSRWHRWAYLALFQETTHTAFLVGPEEKQREMTRENLDSHRTQHSPLEAQRAGQRKALLSSQEAKTLEEH